jgi:N-carbamoylputrescine amidase
MRIALAQLQGSVDRDEAVEQAVRALVEASSAGAALVVFPEVASTVYPPWDDDPARRSLAEPADSGSLPALRKAAREHGIAAVWTTYERDGDRRYNTAFTIDADGAVVGTYRKTSIPTRGLFPGGSEGFYFDPGDLPLSVVDPGIGLRVGVLICYERNLPEPARCLALAGADLLVVPVATVDVVRPWWELLLRASAVQNVCFVAACNRVGPDRGGAPDASYFGSSLVVAPDGEVLARASDHRPELVLADLDLDVLAGQRQRWSFLADRRPDLYGALTEQTST